MLFIMTAVAVTVLSAQSDHVIEIQWEEIEKYALLMINLWIMMIAYASSNVDYIAMVFYVVVF